MPWTRLIQPRESARLLAPDRQQPDGNYFRKIEIQWQLFRCIFLFLKPKCLLVWFIYFPFALYLSVCLSSRFVSFFFNSMMLRCDVVDVLFFFSFFDSSSICVYYTYMHRYIYIQKWVERGALFMVIALGWDEKRGSSTFRNQMDTVRYAY